MSADFSKQRKSWMPVFRAATERLAPLEGALDWSDHAHEILRWVHPQVTLIIYPHRTSAGNYHARVRAGRCKDRGVLRAAIMALAENSCQFSCPTEPGFRAEGVRAAIDRKYFGMTPCP